MTKVIIDVMLPLKPFSANGMHYAKFKKDTVAYKAFKGNIYEYLSGEYPVEKGDQLKLTLVSGFSSKASDLDNTFKPLLDSMQIAMGFDDKQVYEIEAYKDVVKKGSEYLRIKLEVIPPSKVEVRVDTLLMKFKESTNGTK
jgi:Holliday junction resolvase RusA-like endonuclease